ncbi:MAG: hypothetical protein DMG90_15140 [Acidobacteria bacterium]|jgi:hypothetical protein|nr:MAG: hypothetical protein DMG90_15140 [Acidobacteriota bacterium]
MACIGFGKNFLVFSSQVFQSSFIAVALIAAIALLGTQPAQAQTADTWKSVAIIGGTTAAGAYIGHKLGGSRGALVGAGIGGAAGYAIDRRRRTNRYNQYGYNDGGYYGSPDGYYEDSGYYGNSGNYGPYDEGGYPYASGYRFKSYPNSAWGWGRH